ncbi:hypothetical protein NLJ89_g7878 [Agrocybe chaxingu]|uniref:Uncharacterized protein n=1 Tax=Agrocybe chaxingu TaxID=84603 RepID=A0A9W8JWB5_9AGAR|nr:hypothetical protein NLJ89_g7878 [Agrocybe chaxingu]
MLFSSLFAAVLFASASVASPVVAPQELIVFNPPITSPKASVAWPKGSEQVIQWDTTGIPTSRISTTGVVLLGHMKNGSENLDIDHPLAVGFPLHAGSVKVITPNVTARNDYFVVLFGDSGNKSPKFKIH